MYVLHKGGMFFFSSEEGSGERCQLKLIETRTLLCKIRYCVRQKEGQLCQTGLPVALNPLLDVLPLGHLITWTNWKCCPLGVKSSLLHYQSPEPSNPTWIYFADKY